MTILIDDVDVERVVGVLLSLSGRKLLLGKSLVEILEPIGLSLEEFDTICDRFTNKKLFKVNSSGEFLRDKEKNLIKINYDNLIE